MTTNYNPHKSSLMYLEAREAGEKIKQQLLKNKSPIEKIVENLKSFNPHAVMAVGRGSSDHAGVFAKYLIEIEIGIPVFAAAPSVTTIYNKTVNLNGVLVLIMSQSGRSPDIIEQARQARANGAFCIALLNDEEAPLANEVDYVIPLSVGKEESVAATKSYMATISAILQLVAYWKNDADLIESLNTIYQSLEQAVNSPSQLRFEDLDAVKNLVVLGRGLGYAISREIALKLKEVCSIHAEAFSSSEFLHGPVTLVDKKFKIIDVLIEDESAKAHKQQIAEMKQRGAEIVHLHQIVENLHPRIAALAVLQRFYLDIENIAVSRGLDPDKPAGLKKVTETI